MPATAEAYERKLARTNEAAKASRRKANDIGEIPRKRSHRLFEQCRFDLLKFLTSVFPKTTGLKPFCPEQKQAAKNIQTATLKGGYICQALPRGFCKTSITTRAALWAVMYGHAKYVVIYAANKTLSEEILSGIKMELQTNPKLLSMCPEMCFPIRQLENNALKAKKQTYDERYTHIQWKADQIVLPTIPDFAGSGGCIEVKAMNAARGAFKTTAAGSVVRPDLQLFDDIQTDDDAENPNTVHKICKRVQTALMGGGHFEPTAAVMSITVIDDDDVAVRHLENRAWVSVRYSMLKSLPRDFEDPDGKRWKEYFDIRQAFDKDDADSKDRALRAGNEYYKKHRREMDAGADATWKHCFRDNELSAIQHAMNIICDNGRATFDHECQNQIHEDEDKSRYDFNWKSVASKMIETPANVVPESTTELLGHIDVHESVLSFGLIGFNSTFGGHLIRRGVFPEQTSINFAFRKARRTIVDIAPAGSDMDGAIYHAVSSLIDDLFAREFVTPTGVSVPISLIGIDANYNDKAVKEVIRNHKMRPLLMPMKGRYIKPGSRKISEWRTPAGHKKGDEWMYGRAEKGDVKQIIFDANYWKTKAAEAIVAPIGNQFGLTLHWSEIANARMWCAQVAAEVPSEIEIDGKKYVDWKLPSAKPDNHAWDNVVSIYVLGSFRGLVRGDHSRRNKTRNARRSGTKRVKTL